MGSSNPSEDSTPNAQSPPRPQTQSLSDPCDTPSHQPDATKPTAEPCTGTSDGKTILNTTNIGGTGTGVDTDQSKSVELTDEKLERVFREIEEASARRAEEEMNIQEEAGSHPGPLDRSAFPNTNIDLASARARRRKSISVSRVGSFPDVHAGSAAGAGTSREQVNAVNGATSPLPWASSTAASTALYKVNTTSSPSLASTVTQTTDDDAASDIHEEENHTTQKETIGARRNTLTKAMSNAFARTLTRMRSRGAMNEGSGVGGDGGDGGFVIGVKVHEATTETEVVEGEEEEEIGTVEGLGVGERVNGHGKQPSDGSSKRGLSDGGGNGESSPTQAQQGVSGGKRGSISIMRTEVSVGTVAGTSSAAKSESRSRSGSVNKLRAKLPLRGQGLISSTAGTEGKSPVTTPAEERPRLEMAPFPTSAQLAAPATSKEKEKEKDEKDKKANNRLSQFAKTLASKLRRRKSSEKDKSKEKNTLNAPAATTSKIIETKEKSEPSPSLLSTPISTSTIGSTSSPPSPLPPVPTLPAAQIPLPPSPRSRSQSPAPANGANGEPHPSVQSVLAPALVPLPASPVGGILPASVSAVGVGREEGDERSVRSEVTTQPFDSGDEGIEKGDLAERERREDGEGQEKKDDGVDSPTVGEAAQNDSPESVQCEEEDLIRSEKQSTS